jgi:hypothetical protein
VYWNLGLLLLSNLEDSFFCNFSKEIFQVSNYLCKRPGGSVGSHSQC